MWKDGRIADWDAEAHEVEFGDELVGVVLERRRVLAFVGSGWVANAESCGEAVDGCLGCATVLALVFGLFTALVKLMSALVWAQWMANAESSCETLDARVFGSAVFAAVVHGVCLLDDILSSSWILVRAGAGKAGGKSWLCVLQSQHHPPRRDGVGLGVVVVQVDAEVGGEGAEPVVRQAGPGLAGKLEGALMADARRGKLKVLQQGVKHPQIEAGVVGDDEVGRLQMTQHLGGDAAKLRLVAHIGPGDAMDVLGPFLEEPAVAPGRLDQPVGRGDQFTIFKDGEAEGAGAQRAVVGGFEVDGDDFHDHEDQAVKPM